MTLTPDCSIACSSRPVLDLLAGATPQVAPQEDDDKRHQGMIESLHAALISAGENGLTSSEVIESFGESLKPTDKLVFREMLRELAACKRGVWYLKPEFQS